MKFSFFFLSLCFCVSIEMIRSFPFEFIISLFLIQPVSDEVSSTMRILLSKRFFHQINYRFWGSMLSKWILEKFSSFIFSFLFINSILVLITLITKWSQFTNTRSNCRWEKLLPVDKFLFFFVFFFITHAIMRLKIFQSI